VLVYLLNRKEPIVATRFLCSNKGMFVINENDELSSIDIRAFDRIEFPSDNSSVSEEYVPSVESDIQKS
jgi:hypothetical protein